MEKITEKQKAYLSDLSEKCQRPIREIDTLTSFDADLLIKEFINNKPKVEEKPKVPMNGVQWGLALKMVYQRWIYTSKKPLQSQMDFKEEVMRTYSLFEFK